MLAALATALLGLALGARHAFEPDHLAAVSALASDRRGARDGAWLGALWGLGHATTLLVFAGALLLLDARLPESWAGWFEAAVAAMVIALGLRTLRRAYRQGSSGPVATHRHGDVEHSHPTAAQHVHVSGWALATRPLLVGVMHGLSGTGALTALVLGQVQGTATQLVYIALFGLGSIIGMSSLTALAGLGLDRVRGNLDRWTSLAAGTLSTVVGLFWGYESLLVIGR